MNIKQMLDKGRGRLKKINERWKPAAGTVQLFVESISVAINDKREVVAKWKMHIKTGEDKGKSFNHSMLLMYPEDHDYDEKELKNRNKKIKTSMKNLTIFGIDEDSLDRDLVEAQTGSTIEGTFWKPNPENMDEDGKRWWATAWPPLYFNEVIEGPSEDDEDEVETPDEEKEETPKEKPKTKQKAKAKWTKDKEKEEKKETVTVAAEPEYDDDEYEEVKE